RRGHSRGLRRLHQALRRLSLPRGRERATAFQFLSDHLFRDLAISRFGHFVPENETLRNLVSGHLAVEPGSEINGGSIDARPGDTDGHAHLAPYRVRYAEYGDLADVRMKQDFLLDLARINIGAAGNIHVRCPAGYVEEALFVHMAEIAGAEPAVAERLGIGFGIVVVACKHRRADDADLARLAGGNLLACLVLYLDLHAGALQAAGAYACIRPVFESVKDRRQNRDVSGHLTQAEVLNQNRAELLERTLLVGAIHGRACIDDVAER